MRAVTFLCILFFCCISSQEFGTHDERLIHPGVQWFDNRGKIIQAHGGGVIRINGTFYWFGEDRSPANDPDKRYISCYSSDDLVHWKFRRQVLVLSDPEHLGPQFVLERPKVYYNQKTNMYVMYMHLDSPGPHGGGYQFAHVAVATSTTVDGEYKYVRSFRPLGKESRDIGQFIDDDGAAYLIFESRQTNGFFIAKLSDDYLTVEKKICFIKEPLEGGSVIHFEGLYYVVGSHMTGWKPNPNVYATAQSLSGPWTAFTDIAAHQTNTYNSQSSTLLKITGTKVTSVIYLGDRWNEKDLSDSRYIWMPVEIGNGRFVLPAPHPWRVDILTGAVTIASDALR